MGTRIDQSMRIVRGHEGSGIGVLCDAVMVTTDGCIRHGGMREGGTGMCIGTGTENAGERWTRMFLRMRGARPAAVLAARLSVDGPVPPLIAATFIDLFHHIGDMMGVNPSSLGRPAATTLTHVCDPVPERPPAARVGWSTVYQTVDGTPRLFFNLAV